MQGTFLKSKVLVRANDSISNSITPLYAVFDVGVYNDIDLSVGYGQDLVQYYNWSENSYVLDERPRLHFRSKSGSFR